ncbi:MAG: MFS transporter [Pseudomonadota bacterium]
MTEPAIAAPDQPRPRLGATYWKLNTIEMWERLAYFALRAVVAVYICQADDIGGLHLTQAHKGTIYAWWFVFQSVLPMFTGGIADRYGYKRVLAFAISANIGGYLMMAWARDYWSFFFAILVLASGTAFFKPALQGSLAQSLDKHNSSLGWGIFYWVVNIGALVGPLLASAVIGEHSAGEWRLLFLMSAGFTSLNLIMLFTFRDVPSGADKGESLGAVFKRTLINILEPRLVAWLLIMSCFWLMMYQVWDLHPNFISDWVDSSDVAAALLWVPFIGESVLTKADEAGVRFVPQEVLISTNAAMIVTLMIPVSWAVRRLRTLTAMLIGMTMAVAGTVVAGFTDIGWILVLGIVLFSLGEMLTGPKKNEYLGLIAPPGKKGLYLGYVNIPVGIGGFVGSKLAAYIYGHFGEKAVLAQRYLLEHTPLGQGRSWDGDPTSLDALLGVPRTEAFARLMEVQSLDTAAATRLLWETYDPQYWVWIPFALIGAAAGAALLVFGQMAKRWKDMNA